MDHERFGTGPGGRGLRFGLFALAGALALGMTVYGADGRIPVYQAGTLSASGTYYLTRDISDTVTLSADNVTLDLNGHVVHGQIAASGHTNLRITNGSVSSSSYGVNLTLPNGGFAQVDHVTILTALSFGITIAGPSSGTPAQAVVEDNRIVAVTGSAIGIALNYLSGGRIRSNTVSGVARASYNGMGAYLSACNGVLVSDNVFTGNAGDGLGVNGGGGHQLTRNTCSTNGLDGINVYSAPNCSVTWNTASSNGLYGISLDGNGTVYAYNHCPGNASNSFYTSGTIVDGGGNHPPPD